MGMVIHDDFWEAAQAMPDKQRAPFLYAIIEYRFTGKEPKGNPPWLPTFLVIKKRLEMGDAASEKGRMMAEARWGKRREAKASAQADAQAHAQHMQQHEPSICTGDATAQNYPNAEVEDELGVGVNPPYPPFAWRCLNEFNEAMGTAYSSMPPKCEHVLERFEGKYSLEEVRTMIEYKRDEWRGTKFGNCLTPNTLFSLDHFEQYMNQSRSSAAEKREYEQYD